MAASVRTTKTPMVVALFGDRDSAERAYRSALSRGYDKNEIDVVMAEDTRTRLFPAAGGTDTALSSKANEDADLGGPMSGTLVTLGTAVAAAGALLLLPGLGVIIAGPLAAALAGATAVGIAGGLIGALHEWGIPEERIEAYQSGIRKGGILLGVRPRSDEDARYLESQWKANGGVHVYA